MTRLNSDWLMGDGVAVVLDKRPLTDNAVYVIDSTKLPGDDAPSYAIDGKPESVKEIMGPEYAAFVERNGGAI